MKAQCVMCGQEIAEGIVCGSCDRPRRRSTDRPAPTAGASATLTQPREDEPIEHAFPKAPIVPFPIESTSLALTSIYEILSSAEVPSVLLGADRRVRFASDDAKELLGFSRTDSFTLDDLRRVLQIELPAPEVSLFSQVVLHGTPVNLSIIPLSGGAAGTAILLRTDAAPAAPAIDLDAIRQPLTAIRRELGGIAQVPRSIIQRLDEILGRLVAPPPASPQGIPIRTLYDGLLGEFAKDAEAKRIRLQVDAPETTESWSDAAGLQAAMRVLLRNSLHYVPRGGQIVVGLRFLEHKGQASVLFFVMDNGPVVPEEIREEIFADGYSWDRSSSQRAGENLAVCRAFAERYGGQAWVESRTGKACTFFIRVQPPA